MVVFVRLLLLVFRDMPRRNLDFLNFCRVIQQFWCFAGVVDTGEKFLTIVNEW
jgi:hypothetical protein